MATATTVPEVPEDSLAVKLSKILLREYETLKPKLSDEEKVLVVGWINNPEKQELLDVSIGCLSWFRRLTGKGPKSLPTSLVVPKIEVVVST